MRAMFGLGGNGLIGRAARFYLRECCVPLIAGLLCATPLFGWMKKRFVKNPVLNEAVSAASGILQLLLLVLSISQLVMNAHNPFIYFNF